MSDVINAHDLGVAGGYIIEAAMQGDTDQLKAENAKLRELMRDLWKACPVDGYYCIYHCKHYDKESESHCKLEDRMRELGVEVNA